MSRAFIFTMDAALALIPIFIILSTVSMLGAGEIISIQAHTLDINQRAEDTLAVLDKQGTLDELATMFANYSKLRAENDASWQTEYERLLDLTNSTLTYLIPERYGFAVEFWGKYPNGTEYIDTVFTTDNRSLTGQTRPYENETTTIGMASKLITGYEKEVPTQGCVARAYLQKLSKTTTKVITINPQGSGWGNTYVEIWKNFELPSDANISNANFYVSVHFRDITNLEVNDVDITNRLTGNYTCDNIEWRYECNWGSYPYYAYGIADVSDLITAGNNTVYLRMSHSSLNAHVHPGMKFEITYETAETQASTMTKRFYFNRLIGGTGAWQLLDFYVPPGSIILSANLYLHAEGIDNRYAARVNNFLVTQSNAPPGGGVYNDTIDIKSYLQNGTNVVVAYFDVDSSDTNTQYGTTPTEISNFSYVEIVYSYLPEMPYGYIDITRVIQFGGDRENPKLANFSIPSTHDNIYEAFTHIAQQRSWTVRVEAWSEGNPPTLVFESPEDRVVPTRVYISSTILKNGTNNYVELEDTGNPNYYFLPESDVTYTFLIPKHVPYGETFEECDGHQHTVYYDVDSDGIADGSVVVNSNLETGFNPNYDGLDDALQRLLDVLNFYVNTSINSGPSGSQTNPIDVELIDVNIQSESIGGLTYLWGPVKVRLRVWG